MESAMVTCVMTLGSSFFFNILWPDTQPLRCRRRFPTPSPKFGCVQRASLGSNPGLSHFIQTLRSIQALSYSSWFPMSTKPGHANGPLGSGQRTRAVLFHLRWSFMHGSSTAGAGAADSAGTCSMYNSTGASAATAAGAAPRTAGIERYTPSPALTLRTRMDQAQWAWLA